MNPEPSRGPDNESDNIMTLQRLADQVEYTWGLLSSIAPTWTGDQAGD